MQPMRMVITHVNINVTALAVLGVIGYLGYEIFRVVGDEIDVEPVQRPSKNPKFRKIIKRFL